MKGKPDEAFMQILNERKKGSINPGMDEDAKKNPRLSATQKILNFDPRISSGDKYAYRLSAKQENKLNKTDFLMDQFSTALTELSLSPEMMPTAPKHFSMVTQDTYSNLMDICVRELVSENFEHSLIKHVKRAVLNNIFESLKDRGISKAIISKSIRHSLFEDRFNSLVNACLLSNYVLMDMSDRTGTELNKEIALDCGKEAKNDATSELSNSTSKAIIDGNMKNHIRAVVKNHYFIAYFSQLIFKGLLSQLTQKLLRNSLFNSRFNLGSANNLLNDKIFLGFLGKIALNTLESEFTGIMVSKDLVDKAASVSVSLCATECAIASEMCDDLVPKQIKQINEAQIVAISETEHTLEEITGQCITENYKKQCLLAAVYEGLMVEFVENCTKKIYLCLFCDLFITSEILDKAIENESLKEVGLHSMICETTAETVEKLLDEITKSLIKEVYADELKSDNSNSLAALIFDEMFTMSVDLAFSNMLLNRIVANDLSKEITSEATSKSIELFCNTAVASRDEVLTIYEKMNEALVQDYVFNAIALMETGKSTYEKLLEEEIKTSCCSCYEQSKMNKNLTEHLADAFMGNEVQGIILTAACSLELLEGLSNNLSRRMIKASCEEAQITEDVKELLSTDILDEHTQKSVNQIQYEKVIGAEITETALLCKIKELIFECGMILKSSNDLVSAMINSLCRDFVFAEGIFESLCNKISCEFTIQITTEAFSSIEISTHLYESSVENAVGSLCESVYFQSVIAEKAKEEIVDSFITENAAKVAVISSCSNDIIEFLCPRVTERIIEASYTEAQMINKVSNEICSDIMENQREKYTQRISEEENISAELCGFICNRSVLELSDKCSINAILLKETEDQVYDKVLLNKLVEDLCLEFYCRQITSKEITLANIDNVSNTQVMQNIIPICILSMEFYETLIKNSTESLVKSTLMEAQINEEIKNSLSEEMLQEYRQNFVIQTLEDSKTCHEIMNNSFVNARVQKFIQEILLMTKNSHSICSSMISSTCQSFLLSNEIGDSFGNPDMSEKINKFVSSAMILHETTCSIRDSLIENATKSLCESCYYQALNANLIANQMFIEPHSESSIYKYTMTSIFSFECVDSLCANLTRRMLESCYNDACITHELAGQLCGNLMDTSESKGTSQIIEKSSISSQIEDSYEIECVNKWISEYKLRTELSLSLEDQLINGTSGTLIMSIGIFESMFKNIMEELITELAFSTICLNDISQQIFDDVTLKDTLNLFSTSYYNQDLMPVSCVIDLMQEKSTEKIAEACLCTAELCEYWCNDISKQFIELCFLEIQMTHILTRDSYNEMIKKCNQQYLQQITEESRISHEIADSLIHYSAHETIKNGVIRRQILLEESTGSVYEDILLRERINAFIGNQYEETIIKMGIADSLVNNNCCRIILSSSCSASLLQSILDDLIKIITKVTYEEFLMTEQIKLNLCDEMIETCENKLTSQTLEQNHICTSITESLVSSKINNEIAEFGLATMVAHDTNSEMINRCCGMLLRFDMDKVLIGHSVYSHILREFLMETIIETIQLHELTFSSASSESLISLSYRDLIESLILRDCKLIFTEQQLFNSVTQDITEETTNNILGRMTKILVSSCASCIQSAEQIANSLFDATSQGITEHALASSLCAHELTNDVVSDKTLEMTVFSKTLIEQTAGILESMTEDLTKNLCWEIWSIGQESITITRNISEPIVADSIESQCANCFDLSTNSREISHNLVSLAIEGYTVDQIIESSLCSNISSKLLNDTLSSLLKSCIDNSIGNNNTSEELADQITESVIYKEICSIALSAFIAEEVIENSTKKAIATNYGMSQTASTISRAYCQKYFEGRMEVVSSGVMTVTIQRYSRAICSFRAYLGMIRNIIKESLVRPGVDQAIFKSRDTGLLTKELYSDFVTEACKNLVQSTYEEIVASMKIAEELTDIAAEDQVYQITEANLLSHFLFENITDTILTSLCESAIKFKKGDRLIRDVLYEECLIPLNEAVVAKTTTSRQIAEVLFAQFKLPVVINELEAIGGNIGLANKLVDSLLSENTAKICSNEYGRITEKTPMALSAIDSSCGSLVSKAVSGIYKQQRILFEVMEDLMNAVISEIIRDESFKARKVYQIAKACLATLEYRSAAEICADEYHKAIDTQAIYDSFFKHMFKRSICLNIILRTKQNKALSEVLCEKIIERLTLRLCKGEHQSSKNATVLSLAIADKMHLKCVAEQTNRIKINTFLSAHAAKLVYNDLMKLQVKKVIGDPRKIHEKIMVLKVAGLCLDTLLSNTIKVMLFNKSSRSAPFAEYITNKLIYAATQRICEQSLKLMTDCYEPFLAAMNKHTRDVVKVCAFPAIVASKFMEPMIHDFIVNNGKLQLVKARAMEKVCDKMIGNVTLAFVYKESSKVLSEAKSIEIVKMHTYEKILDSVVSEFVSSIPFPKNILSQVADSMINDATTIGCRKVVEKCYIGGFINLGMVNRISGIFVQTIIKDAIGDAFEDEMVDLDEDIGSPGTAAQIKIQKAHPSLLKKGREDEEVREFGSRRPSGASKLKVPKTASEHIKPKAATRIPEPGKKKPTEVVKKNTVSQSSNMLNKKVLTKQMPETKKAVKKAPETARNAPTKDVTRKTVQPEDYSKRNPLINAKEVLEARKNKKMPLEILEFSKAKPAENKTKCAVCGQWIPESGMELHAKICALSPLAQQEEIKEMPLEEINNLLLKLANDIDSKIESVKTDKSPSENTKRKISIYNGLKEALSNVLKNNYNATSLDRWDLQVQKLMQEEELTDVPDEETIQICEKLLDNIRYKYVALSKKGAQEVEDIEDPEFVK